MAAADEYANLTEKLNRLRERRAVLEARETDKATERQSLAEGLRAQGVNLDDPDKEIERLEKETAEELIDAKARVDQFERELEAAANGNALVKEAVTAFLTEGKTLTNVKAPNDTQLTKRGPPPPQPTPKPESVAISADDDLEIN